MFTTAKRLMPRPRDEMMRTYRFTLAKTGAAATRAFCLVTPLLLLGASAGHAAGNAAAGQKLFAAKCAGCHSTTAGENKIGPALAGVVGRKSGTAPGYNYSPAMKNANLTWDDATLDKFLAKPTGVVHGTKMFFAVPGSSDRKNIISYLDTLK